MSVLISDLIQNQNSIQETPETTEVTPETPEKLERTVKMQVLFDSMNEVMGIRNLYQETKDVEKKLIQPFDLKKDKIKISI